MSIVTSPTRTGRSRIKRAVLVLSAGLFATTLAIGGGLAASAAPATLSHSTATVNGQVTVTVTGFAPAESLTFNLDSTKLADDVADGAGAFTGSLYIPVGTTLGVHTVSIVGTSSATQTASITIVAQPTASPVAPTVTVSAFGATGVTVAFSGFTPGDSVQFGIGTSGSGGPTGTPVTVGASGVVSYTLLSSEFGSTAVAPGEYFLSAFTVDGNIAAQFSTVTVVADPTPAAPATPVKATARFAG